MRGPRNEQGNFSKCGRLRENGSDLDFEILVGGPRSSLETRVEAEVKRGIENNDYNNRRTIAVMVKKNWRGGRGGEGQSFTHLKTLRVNVKGGESVSREKKRKMFRNRLSCL